MSDQWTLFVRITRPDAKMSNFVFAILDDTLLVGDCHQEQGPCSEERNAKQSKPIFKTLHKFPKTWENQLVNVSLSPYYLVTPTFP